MNVFRLMDLPDKIIAFDSLPQQLLNGFELCRADGFPRHWKDWMGKIKRAINIPAEKDHLTGQVRKYPPIYEEDSFFYLVDWNLKPVEEKWKEVCDYVRTHVSKDVRLKDKLEDMALPLASNKMEGITLEPEDVLVIKVLNDDPLVLIDTEKEEKEKVDKNISRGKISCEEPGCGKEFEGAYAKTSMRMHQKKHSKQKVAA